MEIINLSMEDDNSPRTDITTWTSDLDKNM